MLAILLAAALDAASCPKDQIISPRLVAFPAEQDVEREYPPSALLRRISGRVKVICVIDADGGKACSIAEEIPLGEGFGVAALKIASKLKITPKMVCGVPVSGGIHTDVFPFDVTP